MSKEEELQPGLAVLSGARNNVPEKNFTLGSEWVDLFHEGLDHLEAAGHDLKEFRIPAAWVTRRLVSHNVLSNKTTYSDSKRVDTKPFLAKLDAVLLFFELAAAKAPIGFKGPTKKAIP